MPLWRADGGAAAVGRKQGGLERPLVPLAGIEPALLSELDFESSASTSSATGARSVGRRPLYWRPRRRSTSRPGSAHVRRLGPDCAVAVKRRSGAPTLRFGPLGDRAAAIGILATMAFDGRNRPERPGRAVEGHGEQTAGGARNGVRKNARLATGYGGQAFRQEPAKPAHRLRCELDAEHGSGIRRQHGGLMCV